METYPVSKKWRYTSKKSAHERTEPLLLEWEASCDPISDNYDPDEIAAHELFGEWTRYLARHKGWSRRLGEPWVDIHWHVTNPEGDSFEGAPFQSDPLSDEDFLTFFTWPHDPDTGERLNWLRLPVEDKLWGPGRADKGGFIQSATGWKPSALQPIVSLATLAAARG